ncbi:unnamed protein product [Caenorhabditis brenneri]
MSEENEGENAAAPPLDDVVLADGILEPVAGPAEPLINPVAAAVENEERPVEQAQEEAEEDDDVVELAHFPPPRPLPRPFFDVPRDGRGRRIYQPDHMREAAYHAYNIHFEALAIHELRRAQMARQGFLVEFQDDPPDAIVPIEVPLQEINWGELHARRRAENPGWREMPEFVIADDSDTDSSGIGTDEESSSSSEESHNEDSDYDDDHEVYPDPDGAIRAEAERIMLARMHF